MKKLFPLFALFILACSNNNSEQIVNMYSQRHYDVDQVQYDNFEKKTGIKVNVIKSNADEIVSLMTPVIKSFFTDIGMEITNDAIQVFGGYGYTKDQGIEQLFRDNRITPIYEGTNSVQAIDLVYRKILNNKIFDSYIKQINEEIKEYSKDKNLSLFVQKFQKYIELLTNI